MLLPKYRLGQPVVVKGDSYEIVETFKERGEIYYDLRNPKTSLGWIHESELKHNKTYDELVIEMAEQVTLMLAGQPYDEKKIKEVIGWVSKTANS